MKLSLYLLSIALSFGLGFFPSIGLAKPRWWKSIVSLLLVIVVAFSLLPPMAGSFVDAIQVSRAGLDKPVPVELTFDRMQDGFGTLKASDRKGQVFEIDCENIDLAQQVQGRRAVVMIKRIDSDVHFHAMSLVALNPLFSFSYLPGLEERARIMFFHVPMAWVAVLAYLVSVVYAILYLRKPEDDFDVRSSTSAAIGTLFCVLAIVTGSVWAKFNWGSFWSFDPKQSTILILLLIYGAYFVLRTSIPERLKRNRLSAVYNSLSFVAVPFLVFILPRMLDGLHPGSADSGNSGPLLSNAKEVIDTAKLLVFTLSLTVFSLLFFWLWNLAIRSKTIETRLEQTLITSNEGS